jgi:hypothetical protein
MLFKREMHDRIMRGEITRTYRAWSRPIARAGSRHRLDARGVVEIVKVERRLVASITTTDARRAGYADRRALLAALERFQRLSPSEVFCIDFRYAPEPDARVKLSRIVVFSDDDFASIAAKLDRMDARSDQGPWTRETLRLIADNPRVLSTTLATQLSRERFAFKADVRKLKTLGLTISHEVGYEVSPRGHAFLERERTLQRNRD